MIDRVNLILRAKNLTARQFADEIGVQPSGMSHILGGRNNPSLEFAVKVLRRYPEIDANWLLLGKGAMYRVDRPVTQDADNVSAPEEDVPAAMDQMPATAPVDGAEDSLYRDLDIPNEERRLSRVLFIYSDNTFEQYFPDVFNTVR